MQIDFFFKKRKKLAVWRGRGRERKGEGKEGRFKRNMWI